MSYAKATTVSVARSRIEIEEMLMSAGASGFVSGWDNRTGRQVLSFEFSHDDHRRIVRLEVPVPDEDSDEVQYLPSGRRRNSASARQTALEQIRRQRWRQMKLVLKAKLEAIEVGISTFEREFLASIVLPSGATVLEECGPTLSLALEGQGPLMLGGGN